MPALQPPLDNPSKGAVAVGVGPTTIVAANAERRYLIITNDSDSAVYLSFGGAAVLNQGIRINASGGWYEMLEGLNLYTGIVTGIAAAAGKIVTYLEA